MYYLSKIIYFYFLLMIRTKVVRIRHIGPEAVKNKDMKR